MTNIEKVIRQALTTFTKPQSYSAFQENLNHLTQSVRKLTLSDVYLDRRAIEERPQSKSSSAPVIYVPVFEDRNILVSMFILKNDSSEIPLHDHPLMYGILKVLHGSVQIQSYSPTGIKQVEPEERCLPKDYFYVEKALYSEPVRVRKHEPLIVGEHDNCGLLTPSEHNLHAVRCHKGPAVFLDILSPPYDTFARYLNARQCTYFEEKLCSNGECTLSTTLHPPSDYWTETMPFGGPKIRINDS